MLRRRPLARAAIRTTAVVGTAAAVSGAVSRRGQAQAPEPAPAPAPEPVAAAPSVGPSPEAIEQLTQLGALREQGILTEEEFAAQKAKILGA